MESFLLDHFLEIIAIIVAFVIYFLQRRKKAFAYEIFTNSKVISISDEVEGKIKIFYEEKPVSNVKLLEIRFENTGNLPIKPEDFVESLSIQLPNDAQILSSEIIDNKALGAGIKHEASNDHLIVFNKLLLNPKDSFAIKLLIGEFDAEVAIKGRIVGVNKLQPNLSNIYFRKTQGFGRGWFVLGGILLLSFLLDLFTSKGRQIFEYWGEIFSIWGVGLLILLILLSVFEDKNKSQKS